MKPPPLKNPTQKFTEEKIKDFTIITQAEYDARFKRLSSAPIIDGQKFTAVGEPSFVASYKCPNLQTEYRVVKMFPMREWEIGYEIKPGTYKEELQRNLEKQHV